MSTKGPIATSTTSTKSTYSAVNVRDRRSIFPLNARVEMTPVMNADDLQKALSGAQTIAQRYG